MAKQNRQVHDRLRQHSIRFDDLEHGLAQTKASLAKTELRVEELLITIATITRTDHLRDLEYDFADAAQRFEPCPEPVAEPVAEPEPKRRASPNRNSFDKKVMHKDWCARLCAIRAECDISVEILTDHREGKDAACNWDSIERAASLEIENNNIKQGIPNPGTIGAYVKRLHLIVSIAAHKAVMAGDPDAAKIYISRADLLQEIRDEIYIAHPTVTVRDGI